MSGNRGERYRFRRSAFDAVLFDLDGVVTQTASVHAAAWKEVFDEFLARQGSRENQTLAPFSIDRDYPAYVDGKPRLDGVASFLQSRGYALPPGTPDDPPGADSLHGIGNRKNVLFRQRLQREGIVPIASSVAFIQALRLIGIKTAVVTSSQNGSAILDGANIADLFDVAVDGLVAAHLRLKGKPDPATFLEAARRLGVEPARAVVVEDATVGVAAGRAGHFGLVIGVDRGGNGQLLKDNGADIVVQRLTDIVIEPVTGSEPGASAPAPATPASRDHG